jgi:hypothetical protein
MNHRGCVKAYIAFSRRAVTRTFEESYNMKSSVKFGLVLVFVTVSILPAFVSAQDKKQSGAADSGGQKAVAIEGLVRDVACPMQNPKSTATNFNLACAVACAKSGSPLIILTREGNSYFPISDQMPDPDQREKLLPFVGKFVHATGMVFERNGTRVIVIQTIHELKDVKVKTNLVD